MVTRRRFLSFAARGSVAAGGAALLGAGLPEAVLRALGLCGSPGVAHAGEPLLELVRRAPIARYWTSTASPGSQCSACHDRGGAQVPAHAHRARQVRCLLCANRCTLAEGERGRCRARIHVDGQLRTLVYGRPITVHVDPIEKKPFYHFLPGSEAYSLATSGCPLRCKFCQNWQISQASPEDYEAARTPPEAVAGDARGRGAPILAFTYNEPTVFLEYLVDIARRARRLGLRTVLVSCGYMNEAPLDEMCDVLDAIKIDLKGFSEAFYRQVSGAELAPVLRSIRQIARRGVHLELVNLVVPTLNDSDAMLAGLVGWIADELGPDVPVHFTRFHPDYQLRNLPATPTATLERARERALARGLRYAYVGNVPGHAGNHTYCPGCGRPAIVRRGFFVAELHVRGGRCSRCQTPIAGVWS